MPAGLMAEAPSAPYPATPDFERMRRDRMARMQAGMAEKGLDALVLLGNTNVTYATSVGFPFSDQGRATFERPVAVVLADDEWPHLFSPMREDDRLRAQLPGDHLHAPSFLDFDEGVDTFVAELSSLVPAGARLALDEWTHAMARERSLLFAGDGPADAGSIINRAKLCKTPDEVSCLRASLQITEQGIAEVQARIAPGVRQTDLTGTYLRTIFEAGADANILDPMWQVMPRRVADGPWTTTGDLAVPLLTTERELARGDVLWSDASSTYGGFHSDFGRTWIVGQEPDTRQREQFARWRSIMEAVLGVTRAGAHGSDLTAAAIEANGGTKPWMPHFYLGHGLGIDSAEMPYVGSDIGEAFDESYVLQAGMILVLEPIVWEDGYSGYRAEEVVLVTDDGYVPLTDYPYDPF